MKRDQIQQWINDGYHVPECNRPIKIAGDILYYLPIVS